jgi:hypothetical protein
MKIYLSINIQDFEQWVHKILYIDNAQFCGGPGKKAICEPYIRNGGAQNRKWIKYPCGFEHRRDAIDGLRAPF